MSNVNTFLGCSPFSVVFPDDDTIEYEAGRLSRIHLGKRREQE
jgi:hypothetical protein